MEIIGDYPAPSFFAIDRQNGNIRISKDLKADSLKTTQYTVGCLYTTTDSCCCVCLFSCFRWFLCSDVGRCR